MTIRPQAEQRLRAGFQRRVDRQRERHAEQLAHAQQLGAQFGYGDVAAVFSMQAGGESRPRAIVVGLVIPLGLIPVLIAAAGLRIPGALQVLGAWPFATGTWFGLTMWRMREPKRTVWLYAFTEGLMLLDNPRTDAIHVRWTRVTEVSEVWSEVHDVSAEDSKPTLDAYRLRCADGQTLEISRSLKNVQDPYAQVGQLLKSMMPVAVGNTMPTFPTIDEIIAAYAPKDGTPD